MKENFLILIYACISFVFIACANPVSDSSGNSNNDEITVRTLIQRMPVTIEEFEAQTKPAQTQL